MKHKRLAYVSASVLIVLGIALTLLRQQIRAREQNSRPDTMWRLQYDIDFRAAVEGADLRVSLPQETAPISIFRESFFWKNLSVGGTRSTNGSRTFSGFAERPGRYRFRVAFDLHLDPSFVEAELPRESAPPSKLGKFIGPHKLLPVAAPEIVRAVHGLRGATTTSEQAVKNILTHVQTLAVEDNGPVDPRMVLTQKRANPRGLARTFTTLCRAAGLPARTVSGFALKPGAPSVRYWNEVYLAGAWSPIDPSGEFTERVPPGFLPVYRGTGDFVQTSEPSTVATKFTLHQRPLPALLLGDFRKRWTDIFALDRLPFAIQDILALLLMLPFGALITALFRNFVGLETFGTFSPVLIALSFKFADWTTGLLALVLVLVFGLGFRQILEKLKLLMVPRLGILLTLVVLVLIFSVSIGDHLGWTPGPEAVFLPMVILAGMIERLFITFEEDGTRHCLRMGFGTTIVAGCCYLLFNSERASLWIVMHPEIHLVTVGALILVGRYVGYRVTELWRFRDLARAIEKK